MPLQNPYSKINVGGGMAYPVDDPVGIGEVLKTLLLGSEPGTPGGPAPGLAILAGPGKYALQRAAPKLARFLHRSPTQFYTQFSDQFVKSPPDPLFKTTGATRVLGPQEAKDLSVTNDFIASLGPIPTVGSMQSGSFERGTYGNPYKKLKRPLEAGDIELRLSKQDYDPNIFRPGGVRKSGSVFPGQRETAAHEGLHGAYLSKLPVGERQEYGRLTEKLRQGLALTQDEEATIRRLQPFSMPPQKTVAENVQSVLPWMRRSGYDILNLAPFGPETLEHGLLSTAAENTVRRARGY